MTADELSTLDLSSCELAVLSACDTNVGERRAGQGVAGLQKALQMAGERSVITSLLKVPDEATKELMLEFNRRLWVEKKPKAQVLWEAKTELREAQDESGELNHTTRDWAAWVLTGEPVQEGYDSCLGSMLVDPSSRSHKNRSSKPGSRVSRRRDLAIGRRITYAGCSCRSPSITSMRSRTSRSRAIRPRCVSCPSARTMSAGCSTSRAR